MSWAQVSKGRGQEPPLHLPAWASRHGWVPGLQEEIRLEGLTWPMGGEGGA